MHSRLSNIHASSKLLTRSALQQQSAQPPLKLGLLIDLDDAIPPKIFYFIVPW